MEVIIIFLAIMVFMIIGYEVVIYLESRKLERVEKG